MIMLIVKNVVTDVDDDTNDKQDDNQNSVTYLKMMLSKYY